jgi:hypothetical protein
LALVQQLVVRLCGTHDAPIPSALMVPVEATVPQNCFCETVVRLHNTFRGFVVSEPSCKFDALTSRPGADALENTGVVVRLTERHRGDDGISHDTAFHGALLSSSTSKADAVALAMEASALPGGMDVPIGEVETKMALHVCAVQAERCDLGTLVTLYGPIGIAGESIHERGGAWVWVENAAIRPIDRSLLSSFCVRPCSKASIMPGNDALCDVYREHFARASILYTNIEGYRLALCGPRPPHSPHSPHSPPTVGSDLACLPPRPDSVASADDVANERFILGSLRVSLGSKRTTIGDAYAYLLEYNPPTHATKLLMASAGRLGVKASLSDMLKLCCESIEVNQNGIVAGVAEQNSRLKRLADVALASRVDDVCDVHYATTPAAKRPKPAIAVRDDVLKRMLRSLHLTTGGSATIHRKSKSDLDRVTAVLCTALEGVHPPPVAAYDALRLLTHNKLLTADCVVWENSVVRALGSCIDVILRGSGIVADTDVFLLSTRSYSTHTSGVFVERMTEDGVLATSSFDAMCTVEKPRVLLIGFVMGGGQARLTAAVPRT